MVSAREMMIIKLLADGGIFAVMSNNRKSIPAMHLLMMMLLLLCLHVNMLFMGHLGPITVSRRGSLGRVLVDVHIMCVVLVMRHVMLIKLLEERTSGGKMRRGR